MQLTSRKDEILDRNFAQDITEPNSNEPLAALRLVMLDRPPFYRSNGNLQLCPITVCLV